MHGNLARLGAEHITLHTDYVAYVKEFFEHNVVHILVLAGANLVTAHIHLYAACGIQQLHKGSLSHDTAAHDTSGHMHAARLSLIVLEIILDFGGMSIHRI